MIRPEIVYQQVAPGVIRKIVDKDVRPELIERLNVAIRKLQDDKPIGDVVSQLVRDLSHEMRRRSVVVGFGPKAPDASGVYFVKQEVNSQTLVKIGYASSLASRLSNMRTANPWPMDVVYFELRREPQLREEELHVKFAAARVTGEWFQWHGQIEEFVSEQMAMMAEIKPDPDLQMEIMFPYARRDR